MSVCLLCLVWPLAAQTNSKIRELQSRRGALQKEIAASEKMLLSTRKDVRSQLNDLNVLTGQIEQRKELIATIERDVKTLDGELGKLQARLGRLRDQLADRKEKYAASLRYSYRNRSVQDKLMFVFSADDLAQTYRRLRYVREYGDFQRRQAEDIMRACPYVDPYSVENNWKPRAQTLVADFREADAKRAGIGRGDVGNALQAATDGMPVGVLNDDDRMVMVNLMVRQADGQEIRSLNDIPVWGTMNVRTPDASMQALLSGGVSADEMQRDMFKSVPLSSVADNLHLSWDENMVMRVNGQRAIEAECDPNTDLYDATPAKVLSYIKEDIEAIPLPEGYSMQWVGEQELQSEAIGGLMKYVPITLFLVLFILLLLFNSWKKVILILMCFPFVLCGITPALLAFRQPFTFMAIIGMMGLLGMMVKNAIVLVDEINRLQTEERRHPYHAVVEATVSRVRPVLMASLTTIVGMIPLVGDPMYGSMAITIMGGLTIGTIITLILLPLFYTALFHIRKPKEEVMA